jgi:hypothetical protein
MPTKAADTFERVRSVGLALPDVEATTKYDGSPVLKVRGTFMAGLASGFRHAGPSGDTLYSRREKISLLTSSHRIGGNPGSARRRVWRWPELREESPEIWTTRVAPIPQ